MFGKFGIVCGIFYISSFPSLAEHRSTGLQMDKCRDLNGGNVTVPWVLVIIFSTKTFQFLRDTGMLLIHPFFSSSALHYIIEHLLILTSSLDVKKIKICTKRYTVCTLHEGSMFQTQLCMVFEIS